MKVIVDPGVRSPFQYPTLPHRHLRTELFMLSVVTFVRMKYPVLKPYTVLRFCLAWAGSKDKISSGSGSCSCWASSHYQSFLCCFVHVWPGSYCRCCGFVQVCLCLDTLEMGECLCMTPRSVATVCVWDVSASHSHKLRTVACSSTWMCTHMHRGGWTHVHVRTHAHTACWSLACS